jgi:hypothetical protein
VANPELVAAAPFPELMTEPADRLCRRIHQIKDADVLMAAHSFELEEGRREGVLHELEARLRRLGAPVPERPPCPAKPWPDFNELRTTSSARPAVRERLRACSDAELEAAVAYELATKRRTILLTAIRREQRRRERPVRGERRLGSGALPE